MRTFAGLDGAVWSVRLDDGLATALPQPKRVGWETLLFEMVPSGTQKVVFRPAGWLTQATLTDLTHALREAETVRTRWEAPPLA
jgi:hypothetical protein